MGFWPVGCRETLASLALTGTLFAGPLYETLLLDGCWRDMTSPEALRQTWTSLITWRNIVIVSQSPPVRSWGVYCVQLLTQNRAL
jgi:intramembrane prenyl-peptidase